MKMIYCSHLYGGDEDNKNIAEEKICTLQESDPENVYVSPIHCFGFLYDRVDYDVGMRFCLELLDRCDELLLLSMPSEGVRTEIHYAKKRNIPIRFGDEVEPGWFSI